MLLRKWKKWQEFKDIKGLQVKIIRRLFNQVVKDQMNAQVTLLK